MHHETRHFGSQADDAKAVHAHIARTTMRPCLQFKKFQSFRFMQEHNVSVLPTMSCHPIWNDMAKLHNILE